MLLLTAHLQLLFNRHCYTHTLHPQETAGGERLSFQLFELPRTDREAIGTFLGLARAERAARKRSRARARGDFFFRFQLFCDFIDVAHHCSGQGQPGMLG